MSPAWSNLEKMRQHRNDRPKPVKNKDLKLGDREKKQLPSAKPILSVSVLLQRKPLLGHRAASRVKPQEVLGTWRRVSQ